MRCRVKAKADSSDFLRYGDHVGRTAPSTGGGIRDVFRKFAHTSAEAVGSPWTFLLGITVVAIWVIIGPWFNYSDTWQLVINTGTTIVTFLMVFLIQNTQNRDSRAIHLKLDELIRAQKAARTKLIDLEDLSDEELEALQTEFRRLRERMKGDNTKPA